MKNAILGELSVRNFPRGGDDREWYARLFGPADWPVLRQKISGMLPGSPGRLQRTDSRQSLLLR